MKIIFKKGLLTRGVYQYPTKTIIIRDALRGFDLFEVIIHEFLHYLIHILFPYNHKPQFFFGCYRWIFYVGFNWKKKLKRI